MAGARKIEGLRPDETFADAARGIVAVRAREVLEQREKLARNADAEAVHDVRVACRRLRAVLEIFEPCFESKAHRQALHAVKQLATQLGARRDLDVHRELLARLAAVMPAADRIGVDSLIAALVADAVTADAEVEAAIESTSGDRLASVLAHAEGAVKS